MNELIEVPFYADAVQAARQGEQVYVVVKRVCEALGIDHAGQLTKLKSKEWATVEFISTVAEDGKDREIACLDLDSFPMWLATIEPSRVKPEARFKLIAYQKECARVLRDHFFGRRAEPAPQPDFGPLLEAVSTLAKMVEANAQRQEKAEERWERRFAELSSATVRPSDATWLQQEVCIIAKLQVLAGIVKVKPGTTPSGKPRDAEATARRRIYNRLSGALGWFGGGRSWRALPAVKFPDARALLIEIRREAEAAMPTAEQRQRQLALVPRG